MITRIVKIDPRNLEHESMEEVSKVLQKGGLIVYPTDTFYGLGVNCFSEAGIHRIYNLKARDAAKPLLVVISSLSMLDKIVVDVPSCFSRLSAEFWPGPLTMIFRASPRLPEALVGKARTLGVRLPDFAWLTALVNKAGFPITATSANLSGRGEIDRVEEVIQVFQGKVDLIVDAGRTAGGRPSTVVDLTLVKPKVLREGAVPTAKLGKYLG